MLDPLGLYEYRVAMHVHSRYSDGTEPPEKIITEAKRAGIDVLWMTDHDTRQAAVHPGAGYFGHLLFLVGAEITPPTNHYLALGDIALISPEVPFSRIVEHVAAQGGLGFVAHPDDPGNLTARLPSYRWSDRSVDNITGLEIWNHISDWSRQIHHIPGGIWAALHPFRGLDAAAPETLALWDERGRRRRVVGIGGVDAHAAHVGSWPLSIKIFPYRVSFSGIRTHIYTEKPLSDDWREAQRALLSALALGRAAVVNAAQGRELGVRLWAEHPTQDPEPMGAEIPHGVGWKMRGLAPVPVEWEVIRDGRRQTVLHGTLLEWPMNGPGVWRVQLRRGEGRSVWIYSNPIYMR